jgi:hypothetical protein
MCTSSVGYLVFKLAEGDEEHEDGAADEEG